VRSLKGHGHWVNTLTLSTEYTLRTGAFDHTASAPADPQEAQAKALQRCAWGATSPWPAPV
jgi:ribosome assembly protein 4